MITNIKDNLKKLQIGKSSTYKNMTLFPIIGNDNNKNNYLCFCEEHIESGAVSVNEISKEGVVAALSVRNNTDKPVFIPDGMIFKGGYQTRTNDYSIMIDPQSTVNITTSCVEEGRWTRGSSSTDFDISSSMMFSKGRASKANSLKDSLYNNGYAKSSQNKVWESVNSKFEEMNISSNTSSLNDMNESFEKKTNEFVHAFAIENNDVGLVYACNERIIGFDLFDKSSTLKKFFPKLIKGIALDCINQNINNNIPTYSQAVEFFTKVQNAEIKFFNTTGSGEHYEFLNSNFDAILFTYKNELIHCAAFTKEENYKYESFRYPSYRRNR